MKKFFLSALALMIAVGFTPAGAATVTNGSFENSPFTGDFLEVNAGSTAISGWTVGGSGVDLINTYWQAGTGAYSIDMSQHNAGTL